MIVSDDRGMVERLERMGLPALFAQDPCSAVMEASLVITRNWKGLPARLGAISVLAVTTDPDAALAEGVTEVLREPFSDALLSVRVRRTLDAGRVADPSSEPGGAKDLLPRLLDACPDPVMAADLSGRILVFSNAAEELLGYTPEMVAEGLRVSELYAQRGDAGRVMSAMREDPDRRVMALRVRLRSRQGESIPVLMSAALVHDFAGRPVASVGICRDDRINRSLSDRLAAATAQLVASEKRAAAAAVTGNTAYELNQPLTAAMGLLELQQLESKDPASRDRLLRAHRQLHRMRDIVSRLAGGTPFEDKL